jgi:hypothetical protein
LQASLISCTTSLHKFLSCSMRSSFTVINARRSQMFDLPVLRARSTFSDAQLCEICCTGVDSDAAQQCAYLTRWFGEHYLIRVRVEIRPCVLVSRRSYPMTLLCCCLHAELDVGYRCRSMHTVHSPVYGLAPVADYTIVIPRPGAPIHRPVPVLVGFLHDVARTCLGYAHQVYSVRTLMYVLVAILLPAYRMRAAFL